MIVVATCPVVAAVATTVFGLNFLAAILLFFGLLAFYIGRRNSGIVSKSVLFSLLFGTVFWIALDPIAAYTGAWVITSTVFPFTVLGVTVENYFFALGWTLSGVLFYEHFFDHGRRGGAISSRMRMFIFLFVPLVLVIIAVFAIHRSWLNIPYFFLLAGVLFAATPLGLVLHAYPRLGAKFLGVGLYFAFLLALFEAVALRGGLWVFPSHQLIGTVPFVGHRLPIEELVFWILIATPGLLSYYEFFADNRR